MVTQIEDLRKSYDTKVLKSISNSTIYTLEVFVIKETLIGGTISEKIVVYLLYNLRHLYLYINRDYGSDHTLDNFDGTISAAGIPAGRIDARIYSRNALQ